MRKQAGTDHGHAVDPCTSGGAFALLEAAALSEAFQLVPLKRRRPTSGADAKASTAQKKRRVMNKPEGGKQQGEHDDTPSPKSRFLGVHWNKCKKKWRVRIKIAGRDTHVGYYADEADAALAFDRAIQKHGVDWQKDPAGSLNFPERVGEDLVDAAGDPRLWGSSSTNWASAEVTQPGCRAGVVTPGAHSGSADCEASTSGKEAKITPFHAKLMVASHHPIPSRSYYPGGLWGSSGSDSKGESGSGSNVSKLLDLKGLADKMLMGHDSPPAGGDGVMLVGSGHDSSLSADKTLLTLPPLKSTHQPEEPHCEPPQRVPEPEQSAGSTPTLPSSANMSKHPSPSNLQSTCSTPAMSVACSKAAECNKKSSISSPLLCEGIELEALRGLVALADASAQASRSSEPSPVERASCFATPPPPVVSAAKNSKSKTPSSYLATPTTISAASTPSNVAGSAPWAVDRSCSPLRPADGVDGKMVPTAFKRIAKPPAQHQLQTQLAHQQQHPHALLGSLMNPHMMGQVGGMLGSAMSPPHGGAAGRAPWRDGSASTNRLHQSFRGVTWDKMKKMWRVRVCLAGGGREHVGYFLSEKEGALAYLRAVERIKQGTYVSSNKDLKPKDMKVSAAGLAAAAASAAACGLVVPGP